jgi:hypothetical protein
MPALEQYREKRGVLQMTDDDIQFLGELSALVTVVVLAGGAFLLVIAMSI